MMMMVVRLTLFHAVVGLFSWWRRQCWLHKTSSIEDVKVKYNAAHEVNRVSESLISHGARMRCDQVTDVKTGLQSALYVSMTHHDRATLSAELTMRENVHSVDRNSSRTRHNIKTKKQGDVTPPVESRDEIPIGGLADSPPQAEAVCRHCLQILTAETIKIWKFQTIHLLILNQYLSW